MKRAAIGQVPQVLGLSVFAVGCEPILLPAAVICFLGQPPRLAQAIEDLAVTGRGGKPFRAELPERDIGLVEMGEPLRRVELCKSGGEPVEAAEARLETGFRLRDDAGGLFRLVEQPS